VIESVRTDYILEEPAKCPRCRREILEQTLTDEAGSSEEEAEGRLAQLALADFLEIIKGMSFKPYRPKRKPRLSVSGILLIMVGIFTTLSAFAPYPDGMRVRFGQYVAIASWAIVGFLAYRQRQRSMPR